ncbi:hypothetical protein EDD36DRAFT_150889 [Exophiala viscosa]|uniref:Transcription factor domain-containing protein n=1 Tax=Exophiala viscosa TaxID=2486360 RepID=A0AAN6E306_9EURO|nr:hypothetical protein EDD36DRAFT_150889 [Exophiala viscosa]
MPTKPKRSKSPDSQFLFVNEDALTVTRATKDTELDRTKQSHVQRQNFARKRRLREQSISGPSTSTPSSVSPSPAIADLSTESTSVSQGGPSRGNDYIDVLQGIDFGDVQFQATSPPVFTQELLDPRLSAMFSNPFATAASPLALSPRTTSMFESSHSYQPGHYFDMAPPNYNLTPPPREPTNMPSPPIPLSRESSQVANTQRILELWAPPLIRHYNMVSLPDKFWRDIRKVPMGQMRHASAIHADMQACMSEPAHMYAFLAAAAVQMLWREGRLLLPNVSEEDYHRVPTFFKTKAIEALRAKLAAGQLDHHIAVDVHRLYCTGLFADNAEVAEPHFQALLAMIEALGGLSTFDDYQMEKLMILDSFAALMWHGVPRMIVTWDPGHFMDETLRSLDTWDQQDARIGERMGTMIRTLNADQTTMDTLGDLLELLKVSAYLHDLQHYIPESYKWFVRRALAILHRLLSIPLHSELDEKVDSLRIAATYWTGMVISPQLGRRAASRSTHLLRQKLELTDIDFLWAPHTDCLLWVVVLGGMCADKDDELQWYLDIARKAARELGLSSTSDMEELFSELLFDPPSQRGLLLQFGARMWPVAES